MEIKVEITYSKWDGYNVSTSKNGMSWNVIYTDKDYKKAATIANAFKLVGHKDVTNYDAILGQGDGGAE